MIYVPWLNELPSQADDALYHEYVASPPVTSELLPPGHSKVDLDFQYSFPRSDGWWPFFKKKDCHVNNKILKINKESFTLGFGVFPCKAAIDDETTCKEYGIVNS